MTTTQQYHTDSIHDFIALHGISEAILIVARALDITEWEAIKRIKYAQANSLDTI